MTHYNAAPIRFFGVSATTTALGANDGELGDECTVGGTKYLLVYNACASSAPVGFGLVLNPAATNYSMSISSVTGDRCIGVVKNAAIAAGYYGWIATKGFTSVQMMTASGTASAALTPLQLAANGLFAPASNVTGNIGGVQGYSVGVIASAASGNAYISVY